MERGVERCRGSPGDSASPWQREEGGAMPLRVIEYYTKSYGPPHVISLRTSFSQ
jgi:hypothetical protein